MSGLVCVRVIEFCMVVAMLSCILVASFAQLTKPLSLSLMGLSQRSPLASLCFWGVVRVVLLLIRKMLSWVASSGVVKTLQLRAGW